LSERANFNVAFQQKLHFILSCSMASEGRL